MKMTVGDAITLVLGVVIGYYVVCHYGKTGQAA